MDLRVESFLVMLGKEDHVYNTIVVGKYKNVMRKIFVRLI